VTSPNSPTGRDDGPTAQEILARAKGLVQPYLDAAVERVSPELRPALEHHLAGGGKYVRAGLTLVSAAACGADEKVAIDGAVAIELIHNFSLIHDDIIDRDAERRHRRSVWAVYGDGAAIIAGDALSTLAFQLLLEPPTAERVEAARRLAEATQEMIKGQADDMAGEGRASLSVEECLAMADGKTGALLSCAAALGAILSGADEATVDALADYGRSLGLAFQAVDDVLGVWGEPGVTGKPIGSDLRRHKKTLPISIAFAKGVDVYGLLDAPRDRELDDAEVARATELLEGCGAREDTMDVGDRQLRAALESLDRAALEDGSRAELAVIARYVIGRDQ
jgi:geranylgeranyl diphosphate synthase, type I